MRTYICTKLYSLFNFTCLIRDPQITELCSSISILLLVYSPRTSACMLFEALKLIRNTKEWAGQWSTPNGILMTYDLGGVPSMGLKVVQLVQVLGIYRKTGFCLGVMVQWSV